MPVVVLVCATLALCVVFEARAARVRAYRREVWKKRRLKLGAHTRGNRWLRPHR